MDWCGESFAHTNSTSLKQNYGNFKTETSGQMLMQMTWHDVSRIRQSKISTFLHSLQRFTNSYAACLPLKWTAGDESRDFVIGRPYIPAIIMTSRIPFEGKSPACVTCLKNRIILSIIAIFKGGKILLSFISYTSHNIIVIITHYKCIGYLYNKGETWNCVRDGIIPADFGSTRRFVYLLRWTQ